MLHLTIALALLLTSLPGAPAQKKKVGGSKPDPEKALEAGLAWLARHQNPDGSWGGKASAKRCPDGSPCAGPEFAANDRYDEGLTGLAVLAFLREGSAPSAGREIEDPVTKGKHATADVLSRGLGWLAKVQAKNGAYAKQRVFLYNHAIALLAMSEAARSTGEARWKDSAALGAKFLQAAQYPAPDGDGVWGWRYAPRGDLGQSPPQADSSVTGWAVAALSAARDAGIEIDARSLQGALDYFDSVCLTNGLVGYVAADEAGMKVAGPDDQYDYHVGAMSALGVLGRIDAGFDVSHPFVAAAAERIVQDPPLVSNGGLSVDYYYWYQGTIALNRLDQVPAKKPARKPARRAEPWNEALHDATWASQDRSEGVCSLGGWITPDRWAHTGGPVYSTAITVLALEAARASKKK
jgi:hypothetical protein